MTTDSECRARAAATQKVEAALAKIDDLERRPGIETTRTEVLRLLAEAQHLCLLPEEVPTPAAAEHTFEVYTARMAPGDLIIWPSGEITNRASRRVIVNVTDRTIRMEGSSLSADNTQALAEFEKEHPDLPASVRNTISDLLHTTSSLREELKEALSDALMLIDSDFLGEDWQAAATRIRERTG